MLYSALLVKKSLIDRNLNESNRHRIYTVEYKLMMIAIDNSNKNVTTQNFNIDGKQLSEWLEKED